MVALAIPKAINNLLTEVEKMAAARKAAVPGYQEVVLSAAISNGSMIEDTTDNGEAAAGEIGQGRDRTASGSDIGYRGGSAVH
jgi:hypothetical protein